MNDHLITPTHNCQFGYELYMINGDKEAKVDVDTELILAADVSAFRVPEMVWARLGVPQVKLGPIKNMATVAITSSCDHKYSVASLQVSKPLGRVQYHGSTVPGFSGSLYMNGTVALAMHCHGGHRGGGYEVLYLYSRLNHALKIKPEDSMEFWMKQAHGPTDYEYEDLADDDCVVRFSDGSYHLATSDIIDRMQEIRGSTAWADEVEYDELAEEISRRVPECKDPLMLTPGYQGEDHRPTRKEICLPQSAASSSLQDSALLLVIQELRRVKEEVSSILKDVNSTKRPKGQIRKEFQEVRLDQMETSLEKLQAQLTTIVQQTRRRKQNTQASTSNSNGQRKSESVPASQQTKKDRSS